MCLARSPSTKTLTKNDGKLEKRVGSILKSCRAVVYCKFTCLFLPRLRRQSSDFNVLPSWDAQFIFAKRPTVFSTSCILISTFGGADRVRRVPPLARLPSFRARVFPIVRKKRRSLFYAFAARNPGRLSLHFRRKTQLPTFSRRRLRQIARH